MTDTTERDLRVAKVLGVEVKTAGQLDYPDLEWNRLYRKTSEAGHWTIWNDEHKLFAAMEWVLGQCVFHFGIEKPVVGECVEVYLDDGDSLPQVATGTTLNDALFNLIDETNK